MCSRGPFNELYLIRAAESVNSPVGALVTRQIIVSVPFVYAQSARVIVHYLSPGRPRKGNGKVRRREDPCKKQPFFFCADRVSGRTETRVRRERVLDSRSEIFYRKQKKQETGRTEQRNRSPTYRNISGNENTPSRQAAKNNR